MVEQTMIDEVCWRMLAFDQGDAKRIQHFLKVHDYARLIAVREAVDTHVQFVIECAALVHDIGIHPAEEKYGRCDGKLQEQEGPAPAKQLLAEAGLDAEDIARIAWLVAHHHTYTPVDGIDHQILIEADFLVNLYEDGVGLEAVRQAYTRIFRTEAGKALCRLTFGLEMKDA